MEEGTEPALNTTEGTGKAYAVMVPDKLRGTDRLYRSQVGVANLRASSCTTRHNASAFWASGSDPECSYAPCSGGSVKVHPIESRLWD